MEQECPKCKPGLPPWLATFADLMSLLMCFFVLLLSFAEMDAVRFKKMAESMKDAFGVQREVPANEIVKGVSVIKQEWSPSTTEPSVISEIRQETSDTEKEHLQMFDQQQQEEKQQPQAEPAQQEELSPQEQLPQADDQPQSDAEQQSAAQQQMDDEQVMEAAEKALERQMVEQAVALEEALQAEIEQGVVTVASDGAMIVLRIREKGSFPSGSARLDSGFYEVMDRISKVLEDTPGDIVVAGHTDNVPIRTGRFRSNWELSSARAVTVVHALLRDKNINPNRVLIEGWADTRPVAANDTAENRALNRRVELRVRRYKAEDGGELLQ